MEGLTGNFTSSFDYENHKPSPCASPGGYSMGRAAAEQASASVRPEHIQASPTAAAPASRSPPALLPPLDTFVPSRDHFLGQDDDG